MIYCKRSLSKMVFESRWRAVAREGLEMAQRTQAEVDSPLDVMMPGFLIGWAVLSGFAGSIRELTDSCDP